MQSVSEINGFSIDDIYRRYRSVLCFFALKFTESYQEAEDIVQSVFIKLLDSNISLESEKALKSYLFSAVHNSCINAVHRSGIKKRYTDYILKHDTEIDDFNFLAEQMEAEILWELFSKIEELPSECRKVFRMSYIDDMTNQEIADKLGISVNTVKSQKARAKNILKSSLKDLFSVLFIYLNYFN